ncbi:MAG: type VI secretion system-associated FHA domain protein TagH [Oceanospirillaceae bacterium]|nr:type VI secretion system-associated FHA domain protein TagH [Oceanospirillaceae bacterium]
MKLTLSLVAYNGLAPVRAVQLSFEKSEVTLGRGVDNDFVIDDPDRVCSRNHAICYLLNGDLYLEDVSSSFTLLNEYERIERGHKRRLQSGDRIGLGDAVIQVTLEREKVPAVATPLSDGVFSIDDFFSGMGEEEFVEPEQGFVERANIPFAQDGDYLRKGIIEPAADFSDFDFSDMAGLSDTHANNQQDDQSAQAATNELPELETLNPRRDRQQVGVDEVDSAFADELEVVGKPAAALKETQAATESAPRTASIPAEDVEKRPIERAVVTPSLKTAAELPARSAAAEAAVFAFIQGLGINPSQLGDQDLVKMMGVAGGILNTLTSGVMSMLQARGAVKREFGMDTTQIAGQKNNPLKFSISTEDALLKMLVGAQGYLGAEQAIHEGVKDAKAHQIAVMAGMQAALVSLLTRFEPEMLEARLENKFVLSKKAKYWELYKDSYTQLVGEAEDSFHSLFGDEFSKVYAQQTREFKED